MCTVTFIPLGRDEFVLTSNRDVSYRRAPASEPAIHVENGVRLLYPKDGMAGGTWIGSSRNNRLVCLLNGGFKNHKRQPKYRKSRGLVVTELLTAVNLSDRLDSIDLEDIEPFTLVIVEWETELRLREFVWDGAEKHLEELSLEPRIWSSSTLFDSKMRSRREAWFESWKSKGRLTPDSILDFHKTAGSDDNEVGVVLKREQVGTVSITQFIRGENITMTYEALTFPR
jgi:hypothetical protein